MTTTERVCPIFARLMASPVHDPKRPKLREVVPWTGAALNARARKFSTLLPESFWGSRARELAEPEPPLERRLAMIARRLGLNGPSSAFHGKGGLGTYDPACGTRPRYDFINTFPQPHAGEVAGKELRAGHAKLAGELRGYLGSIARLDAGTIITTRKRSRADPGPEAQRELLVSMFDSALAQYRRHFGAQACAAFETFIRSNP